MPLQHLIVMCGDADPVVMSICDCTNHMLEGGKKDATYIAEMIQEKVNEFDPDSRNTDVLFFNGASKAQKAGQILCQTFPRAYCLYDWEHVLSLFFNYLSKLKPIHVRHF